MPPGTDFPDSVKREARRLAAFKCCYCRDEMGDDVHHIVPKEEGGQGVLDNAILLCVGCHKKYGHQKDRRALLRQAREIWYEVAKEKYSAKDLDVLEQLATKTDVEQIFSEIAKLTLRLEAAIKEGTMTTQDAANVASTMASSIVAPPSHRYTMGDLYPIDPVTAPPLTIRNLMSGGDDPEKQKP